MKNITLTFADVCGLKALEGCASAHDEYSETLDILYALIADTDEAYDVLSHPAKMVYLAIAEKEAIHE